MNDTAPDLDVCQLIAWAEAEAHMLALNGWGEGSNYDDRRASLLPEARRRAGLPEEST